MSDERVALSQFEELCKHPEKAEALIWNEIRALLPNARFWQNRYSGSPPVQLSEFDLTGFSEYRAAINIEGFKAKRSPLNGQPIVWWGRTSGTSDADYKFVPYTQEFAEDIVGKTLICNQIFKNHVNDKLNVMAFPSMNPTEHTELGVPIAPVTSFMRCTFRPDLKGIAVFPYELFVNQETFWKWAPYYSLTASFNVCMAASSSLLEILYTSIVKNARHWLHFLSAGETPPAPLPAFPISSERLVYLKEVFAQSQAPPMSRLWPDFKLLATWNSGASSVTLERLSPIIGDVRVCHLEYNATESVIALHSMSELAGGPIYINGTILEFLPVDIAPDAAQLKKMWELEVGQQYEIFITNRLGFVRYRIHDIVKCLGFFHRVPVIQFSRKSGACIAMGSTIIGEHHLVQAVLKSKLTLTEKWFFAPASDFQNLEIVVLNTIGASQEIETQLDQSLQNENSRYQYIRSKNALKCIRMRPLPSNHPVWQRFRDHNQAKFVAVLSQPVDQFVANMNHKNN